MRSVLKSGGSGKSFAVSNSVEGLAEPSFRSEGRWKYRKEEKKKKLKREEAAEESVVVLVMELSVKHEGELLRAFAE